MWRSAAKWWCGVGLDKLGPLSAEAIDEQESDEGESDQGSGGEVCGGVLELLDLIEDGDGEGSGDAGDVAANHEDDSELADGVGEGEDGGGEKRHARKRQGDAAEDGPGRGSENLCDLDGGAVYGGKGDDQRLQGEGQAVDHGADQQPPESEGEGVADEGDEGSSESGCRAETDEEVEAEHGRREDQRESCDGLHNAATERVAAGDPRGQRGCQQEQAEGGEAGETQGQAEGSEVHGECEFSAVAARGWELCRKGSSGLAGRKGRIGWLGQLVRSVGRVEAELWEALLGGGAFEPLEEVVGGGLILRGLQDNGALADLGIAVRRQANEAAEVAEVGRTGDGEGDEAHLGIAGFGELSGLRDVLGDDQLADGGGGEAQAFEGPGGGVAIGCVQAVGDGDSGYFGAGERVDGERLGGGIVACPENEDAVGVGHGRGAVGEAGDDELLGMHVVGGEEDVLWIAVEQLLGERCGGAEGGDDFDAGGSLVFG